MSLCLICATLELQGWWWLLYARITQMPNWWNFIAAHFLVEHKRGKNTSRPFWWVLPAQLIWKWNCNEIDGKVKTKGKIYNFKFQQKLCLVTAITGMFACEWRKFSWFFSWDSTWTLYFFPIPDVFRNRIFVIHRTRNDNL